MFEPIIGYEGRCSISRDGIVRAEEKRKGKTYDNIVPQKEMSLKLTKAGYLIIGLRKEGCKKFFPVHRLVALQFIPNPENKTQVNHKDGNKQNNNVDNLEWCTPSENSTHAVATGLMKGVKGKDRWQSKPIIQKTLRGEILKTWGSISMCCKELGFVKGNVIKCCKGDYETAYGFKWSYA